MIIKSGRNDPCPCGSGKKLKRCCQSLQNNEPLAKSASYTNVSIQQLLQKGTAYFQAGHLLQAEAIYRQILQAEPDQPDVLHLLGMVANKDGRNELAAEMIGKAISINPVSPMYHNNLGNVFHEQGKLDAAVKCFQKALKLKPDYVLSYLNLGAVLKAQGELDAVIANFHSAPSFKRELTEAYNNLGIVFRDNRLVVPLQPTIDHAFYPRVPVISLELTNNCNLKCPYCANATLTRPKTYIDWALLEKIIDECAERQYNLAWLHGVGEPLLWDRLEEVIALIKKKGAGDGSFGTNGTLLHADRVKRLLDAGLESVYVSIDTLDAELYQKTRGGKLEKVVRNIQEMIRIAPSSFQITIALMNHKDQHINEDTIKQFHQVFGYHENVRTNLVENQLFPSAPGDYRLDTNMKTQVCFAPINYLFIALDGRAAICCLDQDVLHSLGNVTERSIRDIWFDSRNQTTFRNIALGVYECPDVCTHKCILLPPRQLNVTSPGLGLPLEKAAQLVKILSQNDGQTIASLIVSDMAQRDPTHQVLLEAFKNG